MSGFATYERELSSLTAQIRSILASPLPDRTLPQIMSASRMLAQCDGLVAALLVTVEECDQSHPPLVKARTNKVNRLKEELRPLGEEVKGEVRRLSNREDREELFGKAQEAPYDPFGEKLMSTMGQLNETTNTLQQTQQLCAETEQVGTGVLSQLGGQREQLLNANAHVKDTTTITGQAKLLLRRMGRRALWNRLCLYATIGGLVVANCVVLYYGFFHHSK